MFLFALSPFIGFRVRGSQVLPHFRLMIDRQVEGPLKAVLGADQCLYGRSWARIRAYVGGLGSGSEPMWAVLGADQGLCGRSWVRIRAYVGGLGRGSGPKLAVLGHDQAGKWPKPERGQDPTGSGIRKGSGSERPERPEGPERSEAQSQFVQEISALLVM